MSNPRPNRTAAALAAATLLMPGPAHARAVFRPVWYPDGDVTYHIADAADGARRAITGAMTLVRDHTPLGEVRAELLSLPSPLRDFGGK